MDINDGSYDTLNARGCGISTVLSELCFIDPDINYIYHPKTRKLNWSLRLLKKFPDQAKDLEENCKTLMTLRMAANPKTGAYAYFTAARRWNYRQMLIKVDTGLNDKPVHFHRFMTADAQKRYDKETGNIRIDEYCTDACEGNMCKGVTQMWYFCKDVGPVFGPVTRF